MLTGPLLANKRRSSSKKSNKFGADLPMLATQWTAKAHKEERSWLVEDLQELAAVKSIRVTILRYVCYWSYSPLFPKIVY